MSPQPMKQGEKLRTAVIDDDEENSRHSDKQEDVNERNKSPNAKGSDSDENEVDTSKRYD